MSKVGQRSDIGARMSDIGNRTSGNIPTIALTAHTRPGDREKFLEAHLGTGSLQAYTRLILYCYQNDFNQRRSARSAAKIFLLHTTGDNKGKESWPPQ